MTFPVFASGDVLNASDMNGVGLWLVKTQTVGSGVSSVAVTGAFSADYDTYLVTYSGGSMSADTAIMCQIGSATTGYYGAYVYGNYSSTAVAGANDNNAARFTYVGGGDPFNGNSALFTLNNPFLTTQTYISSPMVAYSTNVGSYVGRLATSTSYTGFTLIPFSGTLTGGTIRVYGYRK
jgi:hypothetical protein